MSFLILISSLDIGHHGFALSSAFHTFENLSCIENLKSHVYCCTNKVCEIFSAEIEKQCEERTDVLSDKDLHIEALTRRLRTQKVHYERKLSELTIQMKQEAYIAQLLVDGSTHQKT